MPRQHFACTRHESVAFLWYVLSHCNYANNVQVLQTYQIPVAFLNVQSCRSFKGYCKMAFLNFNLKIKFTQLSDSLFQVDITGKKTCFSSYHV